MKLAEALQEKGKHIITSKIEHHAVLHTCEYLEKHGYEVTYLDVDADGVVSPEAVEKAIRPDTILISIMTANNEIGTIEPIAQIGAVAKKHGILFHTDAVQAFAHIPMNVDEMNIDLLSASGHKFNGPKGVGFLYIRSGIKIGPLYTAVHRSVEDVPEQRMYLALSVWQKQPDWHRKKWTSALKKKLLSEIILLNRLKKEYHMQS